MNKSENDAVVASRLAAVVDSSDDGIIGTDRHGTITSWNRGARDLLGFSAEEMIGTPLCQLVPPGREADEAHALAEIRRGQRVEHFETRRRHQDGRLIEVSVTAAPIRDGNGQLVGAVEVVRDITERRRADAVAARLAALVDSSDDAIIGTDCNGLITSWSAGASHMFGYGAEEMLGQHVSRFIPEERRREEVDSIERLRRGEPVRPFETTRVRRDGRLIDVTITASPIRDAAGRMVGASKVARDTSEQKRAHEARILAEGRYRTLFECAPDGIVIADRDGRYLDANPSMCRMLGYAHDELVGMAAADIRVAEEVPDVAPLIDAVIAGSTIRRQWHLRRKDGTTFLAETIGTAMPDGRLLGLVRDVTEQNQATEALRATEERMRFALEAADVGIWDLDCATGRLQWSDTMARQHGLAPGAFGGTVQEAIARVHPEDRAGSIAAGRAAAQSGSDFRTNHRVVWPDGTIHWLSGAGRVRLAADGSPLRGVGISLDITEHRLLEAQFQQAQKMEALGRLAGGVAHDFNNLLTAISGYCELLLADLPDGDPRRDDVLEIHSAGDKAAGLTRQLLAFSRKQIIEPMRIDLNGVISDLQPLLARLIGADVAVSLGLATGLAAVMADRGQIEQVVMNLAVNARDAMPGGGRLTIATANVHLDEHAATHRALAPGAYVALRVTDTGTGMTPEVQTRLFEPFFTTKEVGKGTGLGMATVHGIVAQGGGSVGVYSEVGRGTAISVYFPRRRPPRPWRPAMRRRCRRPASRSGPRSWSWTTPTASASSPSACWNGTATPS